MKGTRVPMAKRQIIAEWYERKRAIGTFKSLANKLGLSENTVKGVAFARMRVRANQIRRAREKAQREKAQREKAQREKAQREQRCES